MSNALALQNCVCALLVTVSMKGRLKGHGISNGAAKMWCFQYVWSSLHAQYSVSLSSHV
jgi:hypothetical protein